MNRATLQPARLDSMDLQTALIEARIQTLYQPIVRMSDRQPVGLEVLARLDHPDHGTVEPDSFVPDMEKAGLGGLLFEAVVRRAFLDWHEAGIDRLGLTLAVNLPLDVLMRPDAIAWLEGECARGGIPPEKIIIELTESQEIADLPQLAEAVRTLRFHGFGLAIDDVGPDVRDHSPLLDLPFTMLKLDRSLVRAAGNGGPDATFLEVAMAAARRAGLVVIGEGVENDAMWHHLAASGVDQVQGYLVSHPLTAGEVVAWCAAWPKAR
jgi:EAL domain-containing protein (putative c-di-GMP-specific phosphodiesterase class I)